MTTPPNAATRRSELSAFGKARKELRLQRKAGRPSVLGSTRVNCSPAIALVAVRKKKGHT